MKRTASRGAFIMRIMEIVTIICAALAALILLLGVSGANGAPQEAAAAAIAATLVIIPYAVTAMLQRREIMRILKGDERISKSRPPERDRPADFGAQV